MSDSPQLPPEPDEERTRRYFGYGPDTGYPDVSPEQPPPDEDS
jgi:hypothetical protein